MTNTTKTTDFDFTVLPIKIDYVGKVPDKEWPHYLWNVTITHKGGFFTVPYKTGLGLIVKPKHKQPDYMMPREPKPAIPTNKDVMYSLLMDADVGDSTFQDYCDNMGASNDSISSLKVYQTCCKYAVQLRKVFTREQMAQMREALRDY